MVTNPLNSNHEDEKFEVELYHQISTTEEALYMTSNIGNEKPQQPLKSTPQKVRYLFTSQCTYSLYSFRQFVANHSSKLYSYVHICICNYVIVYRQHK